MPNYFSDELTVADRQFTAFPAKEKTSGDESTSNSATHKLYVILEAVSDRIEMHRNIADQRNNWNTLMLNSINMITLTAVTLTGIAATGETETTSSLLGLNLSSTLLFSAATMMSAVMNKIQPSQLVEEQRNSTRLFSKLRGEIETMISLRGSTENDVMIMMGRVLALDKAYPLPLLGGAMIEKFPRRFKPACWWDRKEIVSRETNRIVENSREQSSNGWSKDLEREMREVLKVIKAKDMEDYMRLGNIALKVNKMLAISGPLLSGVAAMASPFVGCSCNDVGSWAAAVVVVSGALAAVANVLEHGGQVGMVFEMYRNCAGLFQLLEETIEATLEEPEMEKRENGEVFEMKVAMQLGRSLSQLRELAVKSENFCGDEVAIDEFGSKLF